MAILHDTTMSPSKLDLLSSWLPAQPWYAGRRPEPARAGGFRLDDPAGEVGIEFMIVTDGSGDQVTSYLVPMTYRASALAGTEGALIGTAEHGVLGRRFVYDGVHDPVLAAQLVALIQGDTQAQAQRVSNTADPTVLSRPVADGPVTVAEAVVAANDRPGTELRIRAAGPDGTSGHFLLRVCRVLHPGAGPAPDGGPGPDCGAGRPCLSAPWRLPDGTRAHGTLVTAR
jgi:Maltokinase N-terminal cap domain